MSNKEELVPICQPVLESEKERLTQWIESHPAVLPRQEYEKGNYLSVQEVNTGNHKISRDRLEDINFALESMGKGIWGICIQCGEDIPDERLVNTPWANLCVPCKERDKKNK